MTEIVNITHETGDLSEYTATVTDSGDLSVAGAAALAGTGYGLSCFIDDTTSIFGRFNFTQLTSSFVRARFHIDPNTLTMGVNHNFVVFRLFGDPDGIVVNVDLDFNSGYRIEAGVFNDAGTEHDTSPYAITDEEHYVEILLTYASSAVANDATFTLWIDGVQKEQLTGLDVHGRSKADRVLLGAVGNLDSGTSGTLYLDELVVRDDAQEIGSAEVVVEEEVVVTVTPSIGSYIQKTLTVNYSSPPWVNLGFGELTRFISSYSHTVSANKGYDTASISLVPTRLMIDDWIQRGLGRVIKTYNPNTVQVWEGFVDQIDISFGPLQMSIGPMMNIKNSVYFSYTDFDLNVKIVDFGEDTDSQGRYGPIQAVENSGKMTETMAASALATLLLEQASPDTSYTVGTGGALTMTLQCKGFSHLFGKYVYIDLSENETQTVREKLINVIGTHPYSLFSQDYSQIETNTLDVPKFEADYRTAETIINELLSLGGDSDNNRRILGVGNDRVVYYKEIPSTPAYILYISSPAQEIITTKGQSVEPWNLRAGEWMTINDFLPSLGVITLGNDPRAIFIESVTYTAPYGYSIQSGNTEKLPQLLAKLGGYG